MKRISKPIVVLASTSILVAICAWSIWFKQESQHAHVQQDILTVSKDYGDSHPQIVRLIPNTTEVQNKSMYIVELRGHFQHGRVHSSDLEFSILADGTMAWAIVNHEGTINGPDILFH